MLGEPLEPDPIGPARAVDAPDIDPLIAAVRELHRLD
jgi:hypothetical protein